MESIYAWREQKQEVPRQVPRYVSKHAVNAKVPTDATTTRQRNARRKVKPSVPRRHERPTSGTTTSRDFVVTNAIEAILSVPKAGARERVRYVNKRDYGKRPSYLDKVEAEVRAEKDMLRRASEEQQALRQLRECEERGEAPPVPLPEEERQALLRQLKQRWSAANTEYQKKAHIELLDTQSMVDTKTRLENNLNEIEQAIKALSKPNILVQG